MRKLVLTLLLTLLAAPALAADPLGQWKQQDNAASTTVVGTFGGDGTLTGGDDTEDIDTAGPGTRLTSALDLDGSADYIDVTDISRTDAQDGFLCTWFRRDSTTGDVVFMGAATTGRRRFGSASNTNLFYIDASNATHNWTVSALGTTWHHAALLRQASDDTLHMYLDGVELSGTPTSNTAMTVGLLGGSDTSGTPHYMNGALCDSRVYGDDQSANLPAIIAEANASLLLKMHYYHGMRGD